MPADVVGTVLTWKDGILIGIGIGLWFNARGRRHQGERLGALERGMVLLAKVAGVDLDEDSSPGRPRERKPPPREAPPWPLCTHPSGCLAKADVEGGRCPMHREPGWPWDKRGP